MIVGKEASSDVAFSEPVEPMAVADAAVPENVVPEPAEQATPVVAIDLAPGADLASEPPPGAAADAVSEQIDEVPDLAEASARRDEPAIERLQTDTADDLADASHITAQAFDEARDRLRTLAAPAAAQASGFEPFKFGTDMFKGYPAPDFTRATEAMAELNARAMGQWRSSAEAALAHWQSLAGVRSLSEAIVLNAGFARQQIETMNAHARELTEIASRTARDTVKPRG